MLFSIPKEQIEYKGGFNNSKINFENKQFVITENDKQYKLDIKDLAKIYLVKNNYISTSIYPDADKLNMYFFNRKEFNFTQELTTYENIKNIISLLKDIDEKYLLDFSKEIPETDYLNIINFYQNLIYYLVKQIQSLKLDKCLILESSYSLLYKCNELTNMSLEYTNKLSESLGTLYRDLTIEIGKLIE